MGRVSSCSLCCLITSVGSLLVQEEIPWNGNVRVLLPVDDEYNVTVVDVKAESRNVTPEADTQATLVSSWVLFHFFGNSTGMVQGEQLGFFVTAVRNAIADALDVCRPSLGVISVRAVNFAETELRPSGRRRRWRTPSGRAAAIVRGEKVDDFVEDEVNITQIKVDYDVRMLEGMRDSDSEVERRVDGLQHYARFFDLSQKFATSFAWVQALPDGGVTLDDVGDASRHVAWRPQVSQSDVVTCREEQALQGAREMHQFVVVVALALISLIACAGSTIFTVKYTVNVPSRWNPLLERVGD